MKKIEVRQVQMETLTTVLLFFLLGNRFGYAYRTGTGYINIDCGNNKTNNETIKSDSEYIDTGTNAEILNQDIIDYFDAEPLKTLRSFPDGKRNCYSIKPENGKESKYLIRARFLYGNYDNLNAPPKFDLYIGVDYWGTLNHSYSVVEIIYKPVSDLIHVCLVNTGHGTPFISDLVLRPVNSLLYNSGSGSLRTIRRYDTGEKVSNAFYHSYDNDILDRYWTELPTEKFEDWSITNSTTSEALRKLKESECQIPLKVFMTAATPATGRKELNIRILKVGTDPNAEYYFYWHFAETQLFSDGNLRQIQITTMNNPNPMEPLITLQYMTPLTVNSSSVKLNPESMNDPSLYFSIASADSLHLPILNAVEVFIDMNLSVQPTHQDDVNAIMDVKEKYQHQIKGWGGDPCLPIIPWHGLNCSISSTDSQRIVGLDLSHMNLTGPILTSVFQLTLLNSLNLSYNNLTGEIPEDIGEMQNLQYIDLSGNLLSGNVPIKLLEKKKSGAIITLRYDSNLCASYACMKKKQPKYLVPLIITGSILSLLVIGGAILCVRNWKTEESDGSSRLNPKNRRFTESEMANITNNYSTQIGKGGFAIVYLGTLGDTQVAVKRLNQNSTLGIFQDEAELLMRVYHKNLVSLVGYCDAGNTMALVYEYMAKGDLKKHLTAEQTNISGWKQRLRIAVDIAQGLEYLHRGCKPPIIHRDIKPANILLDDNLHAKISDFGMSRMFQSEGEDDNTKSYLVGTHGYMDPDNAGRLNERSDVYSFGVILLELITGKPAILPRGQNQKGSIHIIDWVNSVLSNDKANKRSILDQRFNGDYSIESVKKAVEIARECVQLNRIQRPTMEEVMSELKLSLAIENEHNPRSIIELHRASSSTSSNAIFDIEQAHQEL
ncbi:senescence-induced receptor-like serine/threonine-protein kinase isoform X2 [Amaranthus tricolor]|uniref:senescence-induced receptor-like serine/threonine-protein kinase isoform X2 n=1 Tax=Amaranthus tricolor TaxID=29722 RepID=UPI0025868F29|nr:senescence-induced receptor-like serine/threonine-protein kinase isoform X2 [Amaranthus tricolor]